MLDSQRRGASSSSSSRVDSRGLLFKAKKFAASRLSDSRTGRSFLLSHFGEPGVAITEALKSSALKYGDGRTARELKRDVLKLVTKAVLLSSNGVVRELGPAAKEATFACLSGVLEALEAAYNDPVRVSKLIADCHDALLPVLQPHVREHNWRRLTRVFRFYGDYDFVRTLLNDYDAEKQKLAKAIRELAHPFEAELRETSRFLARRLETRLKQLHAVVEAPSLNLLLEHDRGVDVLATFFHKSALAKHLHFLKAVDYFESTANVSLRAARAAQVKDRFFDADPSLFPADIRKDVDDALHSSHPPPLRTFDAAKLDAKRRLSAVFDASFVDSPVYAELKEDRDYLAFRVQFNALRLKQQHYDDEKKAPHDKGLSPSLELYVSGGSANLKSALPCIVDDLAAIEDDGILEEESKKEDCCALTTTTTEKKKAATAHHHHHHHHQHQKEEKPPHHNPHQTTPSLKTLSITGPGPYVVIIDDDDDDDDDATTATKTQSTIRSALASY